MPTTEDVTLHAVDHTGQPITFTDYVYDGDEVDLYDEPEEEKGYQGSRIVYRENGEWRLRRLTEAEQERRLGRLRRNMGLDPGKPYGPFPKGESNVDGKDLTDGN